MKKYGSCHLCKRDQVELHKKSYIIPKFMFKHIFGDEGPRLIFVDPDSLDIIKEVPDSPYEKYIFCKDCEVSQSALESKASQLLNHQKLNPKNTLRSEGSAGAQLIFTDVDSKELKRFLLLLLWRAHLSSHETFMNVNLGPYAEQFRKIINKKKEVSTSNCHFHIFNFKNVLDEKVQHICSPFLSLKISGRNCYCIFVDGVGYLYHFGHHGNELMNVTELDSDKGLKVNLPNRKASKVLFRLFGMDRFNIL